MSTIKRVTFSGSRQPVRGATPAKPARRLLFVELAGLDAKNNARRLAEYIAKLDNLGQSA